MHHVVENPGTDLSRSTILVFFPFPLLKDQILIKASRHFAETKGNYWGFLLFELFPLPLTALILHIIHMTQQHPLSSPGSHKVLFHCFSHSHRQTKDVLFCLPTREQLCSLPLEHGDPLGCPQKEEFVPPWLCVFVSLCSCLPISWAVTLGMRTLSCSAEEQSSPGQWGQATTKVSVTRAALNIGQHRVRPGCGSLNPAVKGGPDPSAGSLLAQHLPLSRGTSQPCCLGSRCWDCTNPFHCPRLGTAGCNSCTAHSSKGAEERSLPCQTLHSPGGSSLQAAGSGFKAAPPKEHHRAWGEERAPMGSSERCEHPASENSTAHCSARSSLT